MSGRVFEARYYGRCGCGCGDRIQPGDEVCYEDDELVLAEHATDPRYGEDDR